jgi:hypothetical protein
MRIGMIDCQAIRKRWEAVGSKLDERGRRVFAAGEVRAAGWGGLEAVSEITGLARSTIGRGLKDLDAGPLPKGRVRRKGGGPRALSSRDPTLIDDLRRIVEPATLGCPVRPLRWVSKSHDKLAVALQRMGHRISPNSVRRLLLALGYSRQSNRKADEGSKHPDRDAQFEHINAKVIAAQAADQPVISAVFQVGFEHPDWYNGFEHDPEEAVRVRVRLLRELAANRESLVATHLSFPSVCHVAVAGDVFRWVPGPWEY